MLQFWENPGGIANLVSLVELEKNGWVAEYRTGNVWEGTSPDGKITLKFLNEKKGVGMAAKYVYGMLLVLPSVQ
jgi:hypothetical protein